MRILLILTLATLAGCGGCNGKDDGGGADVDGTTDNVSGRVVLHRLNRAEYNNTVQDLLGTSLTPADDFPWDDSSHGYDNLAATLTMSPLHVEMYERAAEELALEALAIPVSEPLLWHFEGEGSEVTATTGGAGSDHWNLWSNGDLSATLDAPADGLYTLSAFVWADQAGPDLADASLGHDGFLDASFEVVATDRYSAELLEVDVQLTEGIHSIHISFLNDYWDPYISADRNLRVDWISAEGPMDVAAGPNAIREALLVCDPVSTGERACAQMVLEAFVPRAWRRPVTTAEIDRVLAARLLGSTDACSIAVLALLGRSTDSLGGVLPRSIDLGDEHRSAIFLAPDQICQKCMKFVKKSNKNSRILIF